MMFEIVKKRGLTRLFLIGVFIIGMTFYVTGCSNEKTGSDNVKMFNDDENNKNEQDTDYQIEPTYIKVSDLFNSSEKRIWFHLSELAYNKDIYAIYVIEEGSVKTYKFYNGRGTVEWQPTLEDLDGKSDEEIIDFIEEKKEAIEESIEISYWRDSTGNKIEEEFIYIGTGDIRAYVDMETMNVNFHFEIGNILNLETILSNQFFGFSGDRGYLISKYNFETETKIILNELGDEGIVEH